MREAVAWARDHRLRKISLSVFSDNVAAIRPYEKFGFVEEGRLRHQFRIGEQYVDEVLMGLPLG